MKRHVSSLSAAVIAALLVLTAAATVHADQYQDGMSAFQMGDYETAFRDLLPLAQAGNADAAVAVGRLYYNGAGTEKNLDRAVYWIGYSAKRGNAAGETSFAQMYERGVGVAQSDDQAIFWYKKAAAQGYVGAENNLARLLMEHKGATAQDKAAALQRLRHAAVHGSPEARQNLRVQTASPAALSAYTSGVRAFGAKDYAQAATLFQYAAHLGMADAKVNLGWMYEMGQGKPQSYTRAAQLYREAALQGDGIAQADLGTLYEEGHGVPASASQAAHWYVKAASQNDRHGLYQLARAYEFGIGVPQNRAKAIELYTRTARMGDTRAGYFANWLRDPSNVDFQDEAHRDAYLHPRRRLSPALQRIQSQAAAVVSQGPEYYKRVYQQARQEGESPAEAQRKENEARARYQRDVALDNAAGAGDAETVNKIESGDMSQDEIANYEPPAAGETSSGESSSSGSNSESEPPTPEPESDPAPEPAPSEGGD